jgi:hypothetical protein
VDPETCDEVTPLVMVLDRRHVGGVSELLVLGRSQTDSVPIFTIRIGHFL